MKHKPSKEMERSLREGITLLHRNSLDELVWLLYEEIEEFIKKGFTIFNDEKRELYER